MFVLLNSKFLFEIFFYKLEGLAAIMKRSKNNEKVKEFIWYTIKKNTAFGRDPNFSLITYVKLKYYLKINIQLCEFQVALKLFFFKNVTLSFII